MQKIIHVDEEGIEDVLYWLSHLLEAITVIKKGTKYEMTLLTMNLYKIVIVLNENVKISLLTNNINKSLHTKYDKNIDDILKIKKLYIDIFEGKILLICIITHIPPNDSNAVIKGNNATSA